MWHKSTIFVQFPHPEATGLPAQAVENNLEVERKHAREILEEKVITLRKNLSSDINMDYSIEIGPAHIVVNRFISPDCVVERKPRIS